MKRNYRSRGIITKKYHFIRYFDQSRTVTQPDDADPVQIAANQQRPATAKTNLLYQLSDIEKDPYKLNDTGKHGEFAPMVVNLSKKQYQWMVPVNVPWLAGFSKIPHYETTIENFKNYVKMTIPRILIYFIVLFVLSSCMNEEKPITTSYNLQEGFLNPPLDARPKALWCWVDGNFDKGGITKELEKAKAKGMAGFDIWDVWHVVDETGMMPAGPAFMSEPYTDAIVHAIEEATRLDMELGIVISSGWNAGGSWVKPEHATMGLFRSDITVTGPSQFNEKLPFPELPEKYGNWGPALIEKGPDGLPLFYQNIALLAIPSNKKVLDKEQVIILTNKMNEDGILTWEVPDGTWEITRYVCTNTGQPMIAHTPNSAGPMLDHFNPEATRVHINYFAEKLLAKLGTFENKALRYFYTDSYEIRGDLWTPKMAKEFKSRVGYDLMPYLPILDGKIIGNKEITDRFLFDYKKVLSDLIIEGHYAKASEVCKEYGLVFSAEAGGPGPPIHNCPFESVKSSGSVDIPRGEFWHNRKDRPGRAADLVQIIKGVSSATNLYNRKYVEAEAFTSTQLWQESPGDLKPTVDRFFCEGLNRIVFHTWPHTPPKAGLPGWNYSFGTQVGETRIWWPKAKPFMEYLARCSYLLQEGSFVGDVLYYYGDQAPNFPGVKKIDPSLGFGFDYDVTNTEILLQLKVKNGKLTLPHGQEYEVLVLPDEKRVNPQVLEKLIFLVKDGATVIGRRPDKSYSLYKHKENDQRVRDMANILWGNLDSAKVQERKVGKGKIIWGKTIRQVLEDKGIAPDFSMAGNVDSSDVDFIHRRMKNGEEVYFLRNKKDRNIWFDARFRVKNLQPERWDPYTGKVRKQQIFSVETGHIRIPVELGPFGSMFYVFRKPVKNEYYNKMVQGGNIIFPMNEAIKHLDDKKAFTLISNKNSTLEIRPPDMPDQVIEGPWTVTFTDPWNVSFTEPFDSLFSWPEHSRHEIKYFSGIASYANSFNLPGHMDTSEYHVFINLGKVCELADIYINGKSVAVLWKHPFQVDVTDYIENGTNHLHIEVANLWPNRMIGDFKLPPEQRKVKSNVVRMPNGWSIPLKNLPNEDYGLLPSGLLGPVTISFASKNNVL